MSVNDGIMTLADGTKIDMATGKKVRVESTTSTYMIPTHSEAQNIVTRARRKLSDLPDIPKDSMNLFAVVLSYHLFGLDDDEIAIAIDKPIDQVRRIKMMNEFASLHQSVIEGIMQAETSNVREYFTQHSLGAARKLTELVKDGSETVALMASKDILDRAGHRPADMIIENRNRSERELTVRFVKEDKTNLPTIDLKAEEF